MRTPSRWAVAIRRGDGGIHAEAHDVTSSISSRPFLRGPAALVQAMRVGLDAIRVSIRVSTGATPDRRQVATTLGAIGATFLVAFVAGPGVAIGATSLRGVAADAAEAVVRVAAFVLYLVLITGSRGAVDLLRYHGAEHKVIAAYEVSHSLPALEDARPVSPVHHRCGTNFAMLLVLTAGFAYVPVPRTPLVIGGLLRIVLLPLVAAIAFELMRLAARERDEVWSRLVTWPGRAAQRLTTREPTDAQLEVARAALERLLAAGNART